MRRTEDDTNCERPQPSFGLPGRASGPALRACVSVAKRSAATDGTRGATPLRLARPRSSAYTAAMFAGIVIGMGRIVALRARPDGVRLVIDPGTLKLTAEPGDSVCVSGCCLTQAPHADDAPGLLCFDVIQETLDKTKLGSLSVGEHVNLETSLTPSTPIGGHFVQGHVDGVGRICRVRSDGEETRVAITVPADLMPFMIPKGSVSLDGVSLTLAALDTARCEIEVALIPTTLERTTLGAAVVDQPINLEADMLAKSIVHWLRNYAAGRCEGSSGADDAGLASLLQQSGFGRSR